MAAINAVMELTRPFRKLYIGYHYGMRRRQGGQCFFRLSLCYRWEMLEIVVELSLPRGHFQ